MEVNIRVEQGRCHQCGHEYVILSNKVEHPKELKAPAMARCPECGALDPVIFGARREFIRTEDKILSELSNILLQGVNCAKCNKTLPLLSGDRADLIFKMEKVLNEAEGLVEKWALSAPFCIHCQEHETEEALINASRKYFEDKIEEGAEALLNKASRSWKY